MNTLDTAFEQGEVLTTYEGKEYRKVILICVRSDDAPAMPYCTAAAWDADPIAILAYKDAEIALLRARIIELERRQSSLSAPPSTEVEQSSTGRLYACPRCDYRSFSPRGVISHARKAHNARLDYGKLGV